MNSCHEELDRNRAGIEAADPALQFQLESGRAHPHDM
eukprot:gene26443-biopygen16482